MAHNHDHPMPTTTAMNHDHHMPTTTAMNHDHAHHTSDPMDPGSGDHGSGDHGPMHDMKMYFHDGYSEYVLFESCFTKSPGAMVGACFVIFFLAILYEFLKFLREVTLQKSFSARGNSTYPVERQTPGSSQEQMVMEIRNPSVTSRMLTSSHFIQTILHVIQVFISYCLMLVFMTYNVWLCLAVIIGAGVGYFLFGWKRAMVVDSNEHCH